VADLNADYVIIGAGSAVRLAIAERGWRASRPVEAGPTDWHPMIHVPAGALHLRASQLVN
jgi:choline dehydrogenase